MASRGLCNNMDSSSFLCAISTVGNQSPHHPAPPRASLPLRIMHAAAGPYLARQEPRVSKTISLRGQSLFSGRVTVPICGSPSWESSSSNQSRDNCSSSEQRQRQHPAGGTNLPPKIRFSHLPVVSCSKASKISRVSVKYSQIWLKSRHKSAQNGFSAKFRPYWVSLEMTS